MPIDDDIRDHLQRRALMIGVEPADVAEIHARTARRRRNQRFAGAFAVFALAAAGGLGYRALVPQDEMNEVATADPDDDDRDLSDDTNELDGSTGFEDGDADAGSPDVAALGAEGTVGVVEAGQDWVLAWGDGFLNLAIAHDRAPVLAGELSPEIVAEFPDEVRSLFPDGFPDTLDEAESTLSDAGLYDTVIDIVVGAGDTREGRSYDESATLMGWESSDGLDWRPIDVSGFPFGHEIHSVASDGDHLVVASQVWPDPDSDDRQAQISVHVTADLVNWESHQLEPTAMPDLPPLMRADVWLSSVGIGPEGWMAAVRTSAWVDEWALLPDEAKQSEYGWSTSHGADGLVIEVYGPGQESPSVTSSHVVSWSDLGVADAAAYEALIADHRVAVETWYAAWDAGSTPEPVLAAPLVDLVVGTEAGFVARAALDGEYDTTSDLYFSTDGKTWSLRTPPLAESQWIDGVAAVDGGLVAAVGGSDASALWRAEPDATGWVPVELPPQAATGYLGVPGHASGPGVATVIDLAPPLPVVEIDQISYEHDGFEVTERFDVNDSSGSWSVTIVDLATGETVLDETSQGAEADDPKVPTTDPDGVPAEPDTPTFTRYEEGVDGQIFVDPATGADIVVVPWHLQSDAWTQAHRAALIAAGIDPDADDEYQPDYWLVATLDGLSWVVEDLEEPAQEAWLQATAIGDGVVIVRIGSEWMRVPIG